MRTYDENNQTLDEVTTNGKQGVDIHADGKIDVTEPDTGGCPHGDCNNPLQKNSDTAISLKKWVEKYGNWSQEAIALERGKDKYGLPLGPDEKWRYVINPYDGNVMDMRHVVVVSYGMGELKGSRS